MNRKKTTPSWLSLGLASLCLFLFASQALATGAEDDDFDNDSQDDFAVFRAAEGNWYVRSSEEDGATLVYQLGLPGDIPVHGNYDSSSRVSLAVYRPSNGFWFYQDIRNDNTLGSFDVEQWGGFPGDIPAPCDFNGDGRFDLTIYRGGSWFVLMSPSYEDFEIYQLGSSADQPIPFDVDSDGRCDLVTFNNGVWTFAFSSRDFLEGGQVVVGQAGDRPIPGKYDGDSRTDFAVYRNGIPDTLDIFGNVIVPGTPSQFIVLESRTREFTTISFPWGQFGDLPVQKDIDDDGDTDITVWRPSDGTWYTILSEDDYTTVDVTQFGLFGDIPLGDRATIP